MQKKITIEITVKDADDMRTIDDQYYAFDCIAHDIVNCNTEGEVIFDGFHDQGIVGYWTIKETEE